MNRRPGLLPLAILAASFPLCAADIVLTPPAAGGVSVTNAAGNTTRFRVADDGTITTPGLAAVPGTFTGLCVETATGKVGTCSLSTLISITAGTGLVPGTITTSGTLSLAPSYRLPQSCTNGQVPTSDGAGVWSCTTPASGGGVSSITAGTGLIPTTITTTGILMLALGYQLPQSCTVNQVAKWTGMSWACAADNAGSANAYLQGGNAFGAAATLGTTDNQTLNIVANNVVALRITPNSTSPNLVGGHGANAFTAGAAAATVAGGGASGTTDVITTLSCGASCANRVTDHGGTVGGGVGNQAGDGAGTTSDRPFATVSGGIRNLATGYGSTIGGGVTNTAIGGYGSVGGGTTNTAGNYSSVGGGEANSAGGNYSSVAGGHANSAAVANASIGGGDSNTATGPASTIAGGTGNTVSGDYGSVGGGYGNTVTGIYGSVPGGVSNFISGGYSFAAGTGAVAIAPGQFVWSDFSSGFLFNPAKTGGPTPNQPSGWTTPINTFSARATGGVWFVTGVDGSGLATSSVYVNPGSGTWLSTSDRASKQNLRGVDVRDILARVVALPLATWNYIAEGAHVRHLGPMAQDFSSAFGLGPSDKAIATIDADGVALAAIQGLAQQLTDRDRRVDGLERELAAIKEKLGIR